MVENSVLPATDEAVGVSVMLHTVALTFEQQKELLLLQMERDKFSIEKEQIRQSLEKERPEIEQYQQDLIEQGKLSNTDNECPDEFASLSHGLRMFDVVGNLHLVPKFDERDPDTFFSLFECVANWRGWPKADHVVSLFSTQSS